MSTVSPQELGFIPDNAVQTIRTLLEREAAVACVLEDVMEDVGKEVPFWKVAASIRHAVYSLGLSRGHQGIEQMAREKIEMAAGLESATHENVLIWRTIFALRALATLESRRREQSLGFMKARFSRFDEREPDFSDTALGKIRPYICSDTGDDVERKPILSDTPLDHLMLLLVFLERQTSEAPEYVAMKSVVLEHLIRRLITDNPHFIQKGSEFLGFRHFRSILHQMPDALSEGRIGGKSLGMLLAYAALEHPTPDFDRDFLEKHRRLKPENIEIKEFLERNTSFFIGSMVFDAVLRDPRNGGIASGSMLKGYYLRDLQVPNGLHDRIEHGTKEAHFPEHIERQLHLLFRELHGRPIIVRSSSELEDRHGASFAGLYESVELANNGNYETDFEKFKAAILRVYASVFSPDVMAYRKNRDLLPYDEEMGILIQFLNGQRSGDYFYPDISVVGTSYAPQSIGTGAENGAMTVVAGLGRSAVDRTIEDGSSRGRVVMLQKPDTFSDQPAQQALSALNMRTGEVEDRVDIASLLRSDGNASLGLYQTRNRDGAVTFDYVMKSLLPTRVQYILSKLRHLLGYEVDCEFTAQWDRENQDWKLKLVQCRPQNIPANLAPSRMPENVPEARVLMRSEEAANGTFLRDISYILYIDPAIFDECSAQNRQFIRHYIAAINQHLKNSRYFIVAPRAWGSKDEGSGIQVRFNDYKDAAGILEVCDYASKPSHGAHILHMLFDCGMAFGHCRPDDLKKELWEEALYASKLPPFTELVSGVDSRISSLLARFIKVIDVREWSRQHLGTEMLAHFAQDPTIGNGGGSGHEDHRPATLYFAPEGRDLPQAVKKV